jgi:AraC-like DNA-binding protein
MRPAQLAQDLGYSDQAHLTRDFRAVTGVSPGEFLRTAKFCDGTAMVPAEPTQVGAKKNLNEDAVAERLPGGYVQTTSSAPWRSRIDGPL